MKIDFGCGPFKKEGYTGIDIYPADGVDIVYDGKHIPLPDNSVDEIYSKGCLEHVDNVFETVGELYRISKPGAKWTIQVPHFSSCFYRYNLDHKHQFCYLTLVKSFIDEQELNLVPLRRGVRLRQLGVSMFWWDQVSISYKSGYKRILVGMVSKVLNFLANLHPFLCDRIWCYWVGGFDEIQYRIKVVK